MNQIKKNRMWPTAIPSIVALSALLLGAGGVSSANPTGGTVTLGSATIAPLSNNTLDISQTTNKVSINWDTFSIGSGQTVNFIQPGSTSVAVNRILGSDPSNIYGSLNANGQVFLINPNGILFAKGSSVNVGGLVASTLDLSVDNFLNDNYVFKGNGGLVENKGSITVADGGYVALLGSQANNSGVIVANRGTVALAGGNAVTLDFVGDGLLNVAVDQSALAASVENSGVIAAKGGQVYLTAQAANALAATVVNNSGVIEAQSISSKDGVITLDGGGSGSVVNSGTLDASGTAAGQTGGVVKVLGQDVALTSGSTIDVSGDAGGGTALIGGASHGGGSEEAAADTNVASGATIDASAVTSGNGGSVVVWSNDTTNYAGDILANGGSAGGNGGSVEVSGKETLNYLGLVSTLAPEGLTGSLLLDPSDYTIDSTNVVPLEATLATTNTTIYDTTSGEGSAAGGGNINVNASVTWSSTNTLTLQANNNININRPITAGSGGLTLAAGGTITTPAAIDVSSFTLNSGAWSQVDPSQPYFYATNFTINGGTFLRADGGDGSSGNPYGIYDVYGLQGINGFLGDNFVQSNYIYGYQTYLWNSGAGFAPIGSAASPFTGSYNGNSYSIFYLAQNSSASDIGLFGNIGTAGIVSGVNLQYANIEAASGSGWLGALAGVNQGAISGSASSGSVYSATGDKHSIGGLVGDNEGSISGSSNNAAVTDGGAGNFGFIGGLAGLNDGSISSSFSTGSVSDGSAAGSLGVGGLVGSNSGSISESYENGAVSDNSGGNDIYLGGLVGVNSGSITNSYATGTVSDGSINGGDVVGGFAGDSEILGSITDSYSTGAVTGETPDDLGGFLGGSAGSLTNDYWDTATSVATHPVGSGATAGITGLADGAAGGAFNESSYAGFDFTNTWFMVDGETRPFLQSEYSTNITNGHQLELISLFPSATYNQQNNISLGGLTNQSDIWRTSSDPDSGGNYGFAPIGNAGNPFAGNYYGNNYTIDALSGTSGLFGFADGYISDVQLTNVNLSLIAGESTIGALANTNDGEITNSSAAGQISDGYSGQGENYIGGLVGFMNNGNLTSSNANVTITTGASTGDNAGGLVGRNNGATISNSYATGNVTDSAGSAYLGGLVGENAGTISDSYATGTVTDNSTAGLDDVGGLAGLNVADASITGGYFNGDVSGASTAGGDNIGGLVGYNQASSTISDSYAYGTATDGSQGGISNVGGLVGSNDQSSSISDSYASVNVTDNSSGGEDQLGGLVGSNAGGVTNTYAIGSISTGPNPIDDDLGGLVGQNTGTITTSWASGVVTGLTVANNPVDITGGLVAFNGGGITGGYYDTTSTAQTNGIGVNASVSPVSVITLSEGGGQGSGTDPFYANSYTNQSNSAENLDFGSNWYMVPGLTRPFLQMENTTNITNAHQLQMMLFNLSNGDYQISNAITMPALTLSGMWQTSTNLDLSASYGFVPIGSEAAPFTGTLYGEYSQISNLISSSSSDAGLFGYSTGTLYDVELSNEVINGVGSSTGIGGVVGVNGTNGLVYSSYATGAITDSGTSGTNSVGGIVGENDGSLNDSTFGDSNNPSLSSVEDQNSGNGHQDYVGGLVGYNTSTGTINQQDDSYTAVGDFSSASGESDYLGGYVGYNAGSVGNNTSATGSVSDQSTGGLETDDVGGFVGYNSGTLSGNEGSGSIMDSSTGGGEHDNLGGLAGVNTSTITGALGTGSVRDTSSKGGEKDNIGGFVGLNSGTLTGDTGDGIVSDSSSGGSQMDNVGGFAGISSGSLTNDQTQGNGYTYNNVTDASTGGSETDNVGGLVGYNTGSLTNSYIDTLNSSITGSVSDSSSGDSETDNIGGLIGYNDGAVSGSYSAIPQVNDGSSGGSEKDNVGGLIGFNDAGGSIVQDSYSKSNVNDASSGGDEIDNIGGLVGYNLGSISGANATPILNPGSVADSSTDGSETDNVGGLVGYNDGFVTNSYSAFPLVADTSTGGSEKDNVGGLIGFNDTAGSIVGNSYSTSNVSDASDGGTENDNVGGLIGANAGAVANASASGNVADSNTEGANSDNVGGLVGSNAGTITSGSASGNVTDEETGGGEEYDNLGGLVGLNASTGSIMSSSASGNILDASNPGFYNGGETDNLGGLVGDNAGAISGDSFALGNVTDSGTDAAESDNLGGLVGLNESAGSITQAYAAGVISDSSKGGGETDNLGGLVGTNRGTISVAYTTGNVSDNSSGEGAKDNMGGFAGVNQNGSINNSYATGNVSDNSVGARPTALPNNSTDIIGGLIGWNEAGALTIKGISADDASKGGPGLITDVYYAGGMLSGKGNDTIGGLIGLNGDASVSGGQKSPALFGSLADITNSYWDVDTSGDSTGIGQDNSSVYGSLVGVTGLSDAASKQSSSYDPSWDFAGTWKAYDGNTYPLLQYFMTPLTITVTSTPEVYSGNGNTATVTIPPSANISDIFGSLDYTLDGVTTSTAVNAGTYTVSGLYSNQQGYNIDYIDNTLVVDPKSITYLVANASSTYGTLAVPGAITLNGVIAVDSANVDGVGDVTTASGTPVTLAVNTSAGSYTEGVTGLIGSAAGNYTIASSGNTNGVLTIDPKTITFSYGGPSSGTYGTVPVLGSVDFTGLLPGDANGVSGIGDLSTLSGKTVPIAKNTPAGTYDEGLSGLSGSASGNYTIASTGNVDGLMTINPAQLTVTANNATRYQGAPNPTFSISASGLVGGDTISSLGAVDYTTLATYSSKVGPYTLAPSGINDGNYVITYMDGILTVETAAVGPWYYAAVATDDQTKIAPLAGRDYWPLTIAEPGVNLGDAPANE